MSDPDYERDLAEYEEIQRRLREAMLPYKGREGHERFRRDIEEARRPKPRAKPSPAPDALLEPVQHRIQHGPAGGAVGVPPVHRNALQRLGAKLGEIGLRIRRGVGGRG